MNNKQGPVGQEWAHSWIVVWRIDPMRPGDYWIRNCGSGPGSEGNGRDYLQHVKANQPCEFAILAKVMTGGWIRRAERPEPIVAAGRKMGTVTARLPVAMINHIDKLMDDSEAVWKSRSEAIRELIHFALLAGGMPIDNGEVC